MQCRDTHAFYVELLEGGLAAKTAEALTNAITKIKLAKREEFAIKRYLKVMDTSLPLIMAQTTFGAS